MTPHRILQLNALATAGCALGLLAARGILYPLFNLESPYLLDIIAIGLLAYAGALAFFGRPHSVSREALLAFTVADGAWVVGSAVVLLLFWTQLSPLARVLVIAVALVVEVFATLQYRAAGKLSGRAVQVG